MPQLTPFAAAVETLKPGATGSDIAALLDNRVTRYCALNWRAGRANPPQWAIDMLRDKLEQRHELERSIMSQTKAGPGKQAGTINIRKYNARHLPKDTNR